jgi:hypothetical protein
MKNAYSIIQHSSIRTAENALPKKVQFICSPGTNVSLFPSRMHDFGDFQISASGKAQAERAVSGARYEYCVRLCLNHVFVYASMIN